MMKFSYAVIKYMANAYRQEVVNVGLVVFKPNNIDVRVLSSSAKVRLLDGGSRQEDLEELKMHYEYLCSDIEDQQEQIKTLNLLNDRTFISPPAFFGIDDISEYENRVSELFDKLVKPHVAKRKKYSTRFATDIKKDFEKMKVLASDPSELYEHKVVHNFEINNGLTADFLLKNGKYHLTETIDYNVHDLNAKNKETTLKLMTFMEGEKTFKGDVNRYFVYRASAEKEVELTQQINLAEDYSDKTFNFSSKEDKSNYFDIISSALGANVLNSH